jgi:hypothetical protein
MPGTLGGHSAWQPLSGPTCHPLLLSRRVGDLRCGAHLAQAEGLTLLVADNKAGYFGVYPNANSKNKPYQAQVRRGDKLVYLGRFATPEEAALCIARSPEGQEAAKRPAAAAPLTSEEARQQAQAEGLTLLVADNTTGYFGVCLNNPGKPKPYAAQVRRGGKQVRLGYFVTAEEAALCIARSPEGQAAPPLTGEEAERRAARSIRRKELLGRWEQVLTSLAARTTEEEEGEAEEAEEEAEAEAEAEAEEEAEVEAVEAAQEEDAEGEECASPVQASQKLEAAPPAWPEGAWVKPEEAPPAWPEGAWVKPEEEEEEAAETEAEVKVEVEAEAAEDVVAEAEEVEVVEAEAEEVDVEEEVNIEAAEAGAVGGLPELLLSPSLAGLYVIVGCSAPASGGGNTSSALGRMQEQARLTSTDLDSLQVTMESVGKRRRAADEVAGGEGGELEEELEKDLAAPSQQVRSQLFLPGQPRPTWRPFRA